MNKYQNLLDTYSWEGYRVTSSIKKENWGDRKLAENYLEKYWLSQEEYEKTWQPIQNKIFINQNEGLPELVFPENYNLVAIRGGVTFIQEDFKQLQKCFLSVKDDYFVIIQNTFGRITDMLPLQCKFPSCISWNELMSGNFISSILFEFSGNEFFVFGQTDAWGKYCANDYISPLDIIGFKPAYNQLFKSTFKLPAEEWNEIKDWLPPLYKDKINN